MVQKLSFSIIIPVYNRPHEIAELLQSLQVQDFEDDFEVIVVDDGSSQLSEKVSRDFMGILNLKYFYKENTGPGLSRNYGMERASGNYFIILDSDVIVPKNYLKIVNNALQHHYVDAYGGPDAAADNFTPTQKAINYAMTSVFTTGGIRGKGQKMEKFHPRSFNMGLSKEVFKKTGGFSSMRYGEDIDLSIRIMQQGFQTALLKDAFVYHKRRNDYRSFFKQVMHSGEARILLNKLHPKSLKLVHWFPALFTIGFILGVILWFFHIPHLLFLYIIYYVLLAIDASRQYHSIKLGLQSALASFVMLLGYGTGFLKALWQSEKKN